MSYTLFYTNDAIQGIEKHKKSGQKTLVKKIQSLINEIRENPRFGTGQPEPLKWIHTSNENFIKGEVWSRRIDKKHRITYEINEDEKSVEILSTYGHYNDK